MAEPLFPRRRFPALPRIVAIVALAVGLLFAALAAFPWQLLRTPIESRLSSAVDGPVTIGRISRADWFSLDPTIDLSAIRVRGPAWARNVDLATARKVSVRFAVLPLLIGRVRIEALTLDGIMLHLVRDAEGRWNVGSGSKRDDEKDGGGTEPTLANMTVTDGRVLLDDAKRHMTLDAGWSSGRDGVRLDGAGTHRGLPMRVTLRAGPIVAGKPWDLGIRLSSPLLTFAAQGRSAAPLAIGHMTAKVTATAGDARYLDDVIEAGLPGTRRITLRADVRHDGPDWHATDIVARVGRSPFGGRLDVLKRDDRTILDGDIAFAALDFDDLSSDEGRAAAIAQQREIGPRVIPDTQIHFEKLSHTDGTLRLRADRLLANTPSLFRTVTTVMTMDHRLLTLSPLAIGLRHGTLSGRVAVDHRSGEPKLSVALRLADGRLEDLTGSDILAAPLNGRIDLHGTGRTIREALGRSSGRVGLAGPGGDMDHKLAVLSSGDVLKSIGEMVAGKPAGRTPVRCVVARFAGSAGRLAVRDLTIDTAIGRADGGGVIQLPGETVNLSVTGKAKTPGALQVSAPVRMIGTLSEPRVEVIPQSIRKRGLVAKAGAILKGLSTGADRPVATDSNCAALVARALR